MTMRIVLLTGLLGCTLAAHAEKIVIKGSNTFGEELGPRLIEEYERVSPGVSIALEAKGSASGFAALLSGECDIAASSRAANEDESRLARSRGIRMNHYTIGYYGTAVVVSDANPVRKLTDKQVRDIFTGVITNWKDVGGEDAPIKAYIRDPVSGTHLGFQELAMERRPYAPGAVPMKTYAEIASAVKADAHAIGYTGMNLADTTGIRALAINSISPTATSVNDQAYPYARQIRLYTAKVAESAAARSFIRFIQSKQGQEILKDMGYVRRFESAGDLKMPEGM